jgi:hypothetical protein
VRETAARHPRWVELLMRVGYVAKGVVYLLVGGTGLFVAVGLTERARGSSDVIRMLARLPMGRLLIGALTVGLVGYSMLSFVAALRAPEAGGGARGRAGARRRRRRGARVRGAGGARGAPARRPDRRHGGGQRAVGGAAAGAPRRAGAARRRRAGRSSASAASWRGAPARAR